MVWAKEEGPVVVDDRNSKAVKPAGPAQEISAKLRVLREKHDCRELKAKGLDRNLVFVSRKRAGHSPEPLEAARLGVESEDFGVFALEDAVCGPVSSFAKSSTDCLPTHSARGTLMPSA